MPVSRRRFIAPCLIGFSFAVLAVVWLPAMPSTATLLMLGATGIALSLQPRVCLIGGALVGFSWAGLAAEHELRQRVAACVDGTVVEVGGTVAGLPKPSPLQAQFDIEPSAIVPWPPCAGALPRRLRLSWFGAPTMHTGQTWQLRVRLRGIRGYQNPGGFDYEAWALTNHIDGAGTVRYGQLRGHRLTWSWDALRELLRTRLGALGLTHTGIVLGLLTGDAGFMSDEDWALFRATGTVHLMVISGLHLTIAAAMGVGLGRGIARCCPALLRRRGSVWLGAVTGTIFVTGYACLAGWGVPVQRAWLATLLVVWALALGRRHSLPLLFLWVGALILANDPSAPLQAGFWLSFGAVAVLLAQFAPRLEVRSVLRDLIVAQLVLGCAMVPLLFATVGGVAWLGPVANLVAVPLVSVVVVPADLVAALLLFVVPGLGVWLFGIVDALVGVVVAYLHTLAAFDWLAWQPAFGRGALVISAVACGLLLVPMPTRYRALLLPCVLLPVVPATRGIDDAQFRVAVLDVGQGLAVLVDTARHRLLYDAGPHPTGGLDLGRAVVVPSLRATGTTRIDLAILSHADMDHVGGYPAVASEATVRSLLGGEPVPGATGLQPCRGGQTWQWDGVRFRILHPSRMQSSDNDRSCVLLIDNGRERVLLPGDISGAGEAEVTPRLTGGHVDVLVAAHHGSHSSSTLAFLRAAMPRLVLVSAGHLNRFGHPHADVVCRFIAVGARVFVTAPSGALEWRSQDPQQLIEWRNVSPPYWRVGAGAGRELSMNMTGTRHTRNTNATTRNESRNASMLPCP
jgi:competence protein ComEC